MCATFVTWNKLYCLFPNDHSRLSPLKDMDAHFAYRLDQYGELGWKQHHLQWPSAKLSAVTQKARARHRSSDTIAVVSFKDIDEPNAMFCEAPTAQNRLEDELSAWLSSNGNSRSLVSGERL